jgi:hypothetical protein
MQSQLRLYRRYWMCDRPGRPLQIVNLIVLEHRVVWLTFAPASANALETSRPIPRAPPVAEC